VGERGQAVVELAMVLPLVAVVVATVIDVAAFSIARVSLEHTAGAAARAAASTDRPESAVAELLSRAGAGSSDTFSHEITRDGLLVTVTVERTRRSAWSPLALLGPRSITADATAAIEPIGGP
jgi:Flp pilus assembly protein TadG